MCPKLDVETSVVVVVKNRCQFCYAFHKDVRKTAEHSKRCAFRFAGIFRGVGGILKFACAVCFDVFESQEELAIHEELHRFPGGFRCSTCDILFLNDLERTQHMQHEHAFEISDHRSASYSCDKCGALFEQKTHLRLHIETDCGKPQGTQCAHCYPSSTGERVHIDSAVFLNEFPIKMEDEFIINEDVSLESKHDICNLEFVDESSTDPLFQQFKVENEIVSDEQAVDESEQPTQTIVAIDYLANANGEEAINETGDDRKKTEPLVCRSKYCSKKTFSRKSVYLKHVRAHGPDGSLIHKCFCCLTFFRTTQERTKHIMTAHPERVTCTLCDKKFSGIPSYHKHMKRIHGHSLTAECIPDNSSCSQPQLVADKLVHSTTDEINTNENTGQNVKCQYCGQKYRWASVAYRKHVEAHGPDGTLIYKCEHCYTYFRTKQERMEHSATIHPELVICDICDKQFTSNFLLNEHKQYIHGGKPKKLLKLHYCAKCGESFSVRTLLDDHEKSECGQSPCYKCSVCTKSFCSRYYLRKHVALHKEKKFECSVCEKKFIKKGQLKRHSATHATDKPYQCQKCDKRFADKSYLYSHMILHTEIKRYVCHGCGDRFPTNSALHKHRSTRKDTCALVPIQPPPDMRRKSRAPPKS